MYYHFRAANGRFIKPNVQKKMCKALQGMANVKIRKKISKNVCEGNRIVDIQELGKNLNCCNCTEVLSLERITEESRLGLHSILSIDCDKCNIKTAVRTGKMHTFENRSYSDISTATVLGKSFVKFIYAL